MTAKQLAWSLLVIVLTAIAATVCVISVAVFGGCI